MPRITLTTTIELIPDHYQNYPDVHVTLVCKQAGRWKAELIQAALADSDCYDMEDGPVTQSNTGR